MEILQKIKHLLSVYHFKCLVDNQDSPTFYKVDIIKFPENWKFWWKSRTNFISCMFYAMHTIVWGHIVFVFVSLFVCPASLYECSSSSVIGPLPPQNLCEQCFQIYFFRPNDYEPFKGETWLKHSFVRWSFSKCIEILERV